MKILFVILVLCSCSSNETKTVKSESVKSEPVKPIVSDSFEVSAKSMITRLDSALYYKDLNDSFALEESKSEALYYKTGNEKYWKAFYKNQDKKIEAARKGAKFYKSLQTKQQ